MSSRNRHAQELHEQTTTLAKFSHWKLLSKNTHLMMWALGLCNLLTKRYLPSNSQNNWLYAAAATKKKTPQQNPFAHHQRSVTVSDDVSWQVKIGLYQSDNYLSQVKISVKTVNISHTQDGEFFVFQQDSAQAHRVRETISFLVSNLAKCWLVLKFLQAYSTVNLQ